MAKQSNTIEIQARTGLTLIYSYVTLWVVTALVIMIVNALFPNLVVLGTQSLSYWWALDLASSKIALISTAFIPVVAYKEWKRGRIFEPKEWMMLYFVVNTAAVWLVTRFSDIFGMGISAWWVAVLLGGILDWAQGMVMMALGKVLGNTTTK